MGIDTNIILMPIKKEIRTCLCCGEKFEIEPYINQDFCNRCFPIVVRETFKKENGNLTCEELKEKIRNIIRKGEMK